MKIIIKSRSIVHKWIYRDTFDMFRCLFGDGVAIRFGAQTEIARKIPANKYKVTTIALINTFKYLAKNNIKLNIKNARNFAKTSAGSTVVVRIEQE